MTFRLTARLRRNPDYQRAVRWCEERGLECEAVRTGRLSHPKLRIWNDKVEFNFSLCSSPAARSRFANTETRLNRRWREVTGT